MTVNKDQIEAHGLTPDEYKKIQEYLGRDSNLLELGIFLQCGMSIAHINPQDFI